MRSFLYSLFWIANLSPSRKKWAEEKTNIRISLSVQVCCVSVVVFVVKIAFPIGIDYY